MLTTSGSSLVAGNKPAGPAPLVTVRVLRSFMLKGKATVVGSEIEIPVGVANEVVSSNKAERVKSAPPASSTSAADPAAEVAAPAAPPARRSTRQ
jgi:hypothetical protein